ncbi:MAG: hypothetical protein COB04_06765 [Gammaproteobacteria bacterium]|nr:MAG: hypothetical protein COB04_06765 [Gammaproteobacteria bacterium]
MFSISDTEINKASLEDAVSDQQAGAVVTFDGRVRNHNEGHPVKSLEYQSYESMAEKVGLEIIQEAQQKFDIHQVAAIHRVGHLGIGEAAVVVSVSSSHRADGFKACQYVIDEIKLRVPVWKKEHYVNKDPEWVACHQCAHPHEQDLEQEQEQDHKQDLAHKHDH